MKVLLPTPDALLIGILIAVPCLDSASTVINNPLVGPFIEAVPAIKAVPKYMASSESFVSKANNLSDFMLRSSTHFLKFWCLMLPVR
ncbi:hypothetical protein D3C86_1402200 [compost metagenome]